MEQNILKFKQDFQESGVLDYIRKDYDIIMVWIAGSTITGLADSGSDYDLGVLISNNIESTKYVRNDNFLIYKPEGRKVQWMYETVEDITTKQPVFRLRNIGWAQFRNIDDRFIIYKNPKYLPFIQSLITRSLEISLYSMYLFYLNKIEVIQDIVAAGYIPAKCRLRSLYHLCWIYDSLFSTELDRDFLVKVKHIMDIPVDNETLEKIYQKVVSLYNYFTEYIPTRPTIDFERNNTNG